MNLEIIALKLMLIALLLELIFATILEGFGLIGVSVDGVSIIQRIYSYLNNKEYVKQAYNEVVPIM